MKKKPIYLWVLLILSALISATSLFELLKPLPSKEVLRAAQKQVAGVSAQQVEDSINFSYRVAEASHSIFNVALVVLSAILVVVAIVFLVRKNLQYANYTYVAIIGSIYTYVTLQDALQLVQDETIRLTMGIGSKAVSIFYIVINVLFLALVFYKIWRQQKALAEEEETEELA